MRTSSSTPIGRAPDAGAELEAGGADRGGERAPATFLWPFPRLSGGGGSLRIATAEAKVRHNAQHHRQCNQRQSTPLDERV
ncbi:MAG: hypothetical protein U0263_31135 [Polyangiaceae bacterium]